MSDTAALEAAIAKAQEAVTAQGDTVRTLKAQLKTGDVQKAEVDAAIAKLKELKLELDKANQDFEAAVGKTAGGNKEALRAEICNVLERRLFYIPSFKIYGAVGGFFDYGPPGCAIKQNLTQAWRQHFVLEENMLEVECPSVTPEVVLKTSGHVERFTDFMVSDVQTKECYRADHLLEAALEAKIAEKGLAPEDKRRLEDQLVQVEGMDKEELGAALKEHGVKAPDTGNDISDPYTFNLMFKTSIGPRGDLTGYMRPETAQGIFVNFRDLLYYNGGKLPFAAAQIGNSFRNEISPRAGLLRVREFTQAEIEHFCDPEDKSHPKFASVADVEPLLYSRELQMGATKKAEPMRLGDAVAKGVVANESLAYFIGRTYTFLLNAGADPARVRFRQHLAHEMAHYACDCWDAEIETSYGWVECAGLADRSAYDLSAHGAASKTDLTAYVAFEKPKMVEVTVVKPDKKALGKEFKKDAKAVQAALEALSEEQAEAMKAKLEAAGAAELAAEGGAFTITSEMVAIERTTKKVTGRTFVPSVIEPSFGIGRILYALFEHAFYKREGDGNEQRTVFRFSPLVAPVKTTVFPLLQKPQFNEKAAAIAAALRKAAISNIVDTTGASIGKRYSRTDEIGVPFAVTVDHSTLTDDTVTVRERDSMAQIRVPVAEVPGLLGDLCSLAVQWEDVAAKYPAQAASAE
ncbi:unnamed protein product [Pedinophyceae sp. YPF-701]|nr:unnamed protein product [Pedinophyceae sp. YPF-701]